MKYLAIETSCDDTAIAVLEESAGVISVLASNVSSQISLHNEYGGVYPMMAKREHGRNLTSVMEKTILESGVSTQKRRIPLLEKILGRNSKIKQILSREPELLEAMIVSKWRDEVPDIDMIVVTIGPGLPPTLWSGINFAKALGYLWNKRILPVDHMKGHIFSVLSDDGTTFDLGRVTLPAMSLLVSGGHTELVLVKDWNRYEKIGSTKDDAVGEAFDKVARILGLPYPGGPLISKLAEEDRLEHREKRSLFPRPLLHSKDYSFSYSGLKTAVLYHVKKQNSVTEDEKRLIAREFEDAAIEPIVAKVKNAIEEYGTRDLIVGGGVSANTFLRKSLEEMLAPSDTKVHFPERGLTGDNAVMIGVAGIASLKYGNEALRYTSSKLIANGNLSL